MKNLALTWLLLLNFVAFGQSNFNIGFKEGFKNGYCYSNNQSGYYCNPPLPPLPPLPQISESSNSYQDGYNRGFLYGQSKRRDNDNNSSSNVSSNTPKFSPYVSQVPTELMRMVGMSMQKKFDERTNWIQDKIYQLNDLIIKLFNKENLPSLSIEETRDIYHSKLVKYVNSISGIDFGDDYQFKSVVEGFNSLENGFYKNYNSCVEDEEKWKLEREAEEQKASQVGRIGIRYEKTDYYPRITEVIYGGAAWKSNQFEVGDRIISVAQGESTNFSTSGKSLSYVYGLITGTKGTMVKLIIMKNDNSYRSISLIRE
jgi:hypothetical protein